MKFFNIFCGARQTSPPPVNPGKTRQFPASIRHAPVDVGGTLLAAHRAFAHGAGLLQGHTAAGHASLLLHGQLALQAAAPLGAGEAALFFATNCTFLHDFYESDTALRPTLVLYQAKNNLSSSSCFTIKTGSHQQKASNFAQRRIEQHHYNKKTPCKNKPCRASIIKVYCFFNSFITFSKYL